MKITLSQASVIGAANNTRYPTLVTVSSKDELKEAVRKDHVCGQFKENHRSKDDFMWADCVVMDCDNEHSDNPDEWVSLEDLDYFFGFEVDYAAVTSRNHMKNKAGKTPRPRFHVYFPIQENQSGEGIARLKRKIHQLYGFFDGNALDESRFMFGNPEARIVWNKGSGSVEEFLASDHKSASIPEGSRNTTLHRKACQLLVRFGDCLQAKELYQQACSKCEPLLEDTEVAAIWKSALSFYEKKVKSNPGYIPPGNYIMTDFRYFPKHPTDVDMAKITAQHFGNKLCYSKETRFLYFNGQFWDMNDELKKRPIHELTDLQLEEYEKVKAVVDEECKKVDLDSALKANGKLRADADREQQVVYQKKIQLENYKKLIYLYRSSKGVNGLLSQITEMLMIHGTELDARPYLLNTPAGTINLTTGEMHKHNPDDLITKITAVSPSDAGKELWIDSLNKTFLGDQELIDYVQEVCGLLIIGKVTEEKLYIAFGKGANGKSTFWNTLAKVLGSYSGQIASEVLTKENKFNTKTEFAELKGKRMVIAAELEAGRSLSSATVKKIASTDKLHGERKYCDPMEFEPTHSVVLYTNHLPSVAELDNGTWRRLTVIPFNARFDNENDDKNYAARLFDGAGGYILSWVIEGAKRVYAKGGKLDPPVAVRDATADYRKENDWVEDFLGACCEIGKGYECVASDLYKAYREWAYRGNGSAVTAKSFKEAMIANGFRNKKISRLVKYFGLRLRITDFDNQQEDSANSDDDIFIDTSDLPF